MVIKVINLDKCIRKFGNVEGVDIMPEIKEATLKVKRSARDLAPVDTGILKSSIQHKLYPEQQSGVVYTVTEYAVYQEFGTRKMKAQPFMIPAMNMHRAGIHQSLKKYLREQVRRKAS